MFKYFNTDFFKTDKVILLLLVGVLQSSITFSQSNTLNSIQSEFKKYGEEHLQEKLFVHTDKNFYLAGEIVWFKLYDVDGTFHKPLNISKVSYVEILDNENKPALQSKIELKDGMGTGSMFLPLSLKSGNYKLRAYTSWMKNFSPDFYFEKNITVINSLKTPAAQTGVQPIDYDVQFFPEGGNLVNDIKSKIGFWVINQYGKGV